MSIGANIKEFFKSEAQKKKEKKDENEYKLYLGKRELLKEKKRLDEELKSSVRKFKKHKEGSPEYNNAVLEFANAKKSLAKCESGLGQIKKAETELLRGSIGGTRPANVGDIVTSCMMNIRDIVLSDDSAGVITSAERDRAVYDINKMLGERREDTLDDWEETMSKGKISDEYEEDYEDTIDEMKAMLVEMDESNERKKAKSENNIDKEIQDELNKVKSDRKKLESGSDV